MTPRLFSALHIHVYTCTYALVKPFVCIHLENIHIQREREGGKRRERGRGREGKREMERIVNLFLFRVCDNLGYVTVPL